MGPRQTATVEHPQRAHEGLEVVPVARRHDDRVGTQPGAVGQHHLVPLEPLGSLDRHHGPALDRPDDAEPNCLENPATIVGRKKLRA
ncbi:hypothetical protein ADJ73_12450 [Arsenicicoccus sp. oral taxon 190]|nr:hypothetical protein ADJ73_12450 [Arsenicicoccus sp. oral taxon 190]